MFEADINKYPTLSSLAFSIYRIKYLNKYKIPCITGELYRNLNKSSTGGSVDVYKPIGEEINRYDVNSLLQTRVKSKGAGIRTVSPLGEWSGWYLSEELYNAKKQGYEIDIIWGYLFEKEYIFKEYVNDLYKLKKESKRGYSELHY